MVMGNVFVYGAGLSLMCPLDLLKEEGPPDGLSDVCHLIMNECVLFVALMTGFHLLNAYRADV